MSFNVEDAMKLPSMKGARLAAGQNGVKSNILGVTVFEYKGSKDLQNRFMALNSGKLNGKLVLASFASMERDTELQRRCLEYMAKGGASALVLYYVGVILKEVGRSLKDTADSLSLPVIVMPENRLDIGYDALISEVSESVLTAGADYNENLATEIIGQVSKLPADKQTVDSVLNLLSSKLNAGIILTDGSLNNLGESFKGGISVQGVLNEENVPHHIKRKKAFAPVPGSFIWYAPIHDRGVEPMRLFLIEDGNSLNEMRVDMARAAVQLAVELWSNSHSEVLTSELVKAILNDEPIRMRRLSEVLRIDIKSIHNSWFIRCTDGRSHFSDEMIKAVRDVMNNLDSEILLESYRPTPGNSDDLIMFFRNPLDAKLLNNCARSIIENLHGLGCNHVYLTMLDYKFTTADVRNAFSIWNENEAKARTVFPALEIFHESEIELARQCDAIIKLGEASIASATDCLYALEERHGSEEFLKTLEVYFLDADMNMQKASEILGVHKNTIKYRINIVCDALGHSVNNPVTTSRLTIALAIRRLLDKAGAI